MSVIEPQGFITVVPQDTAWQWNPSTNVDDLVVTAYNFYYGTESRFDDDGTWTNLYPSVVHLGNVTNSVTAGLNGAMTYYTAVTAVDQNGVESDFSKEATNTTALIMDIAFQFDQPVTNITLQWSPDLSQWIDLGTIPTNGVWRLTGDPSVARFYRGKATSIP